MDFWQSERENILLNGNNIKTMSLSLYATFVSNEPRDDDGYHTEEDEYDLPDC